MSVIEARLRVSREISLLVGLPGYEKLVTAPLDLPSVKDLDHIVKEGVLVF